MTGLWQFYCQDQIILNLLVWQTRVKKTIKVSHQDLQAYFFPSCQYFWFIVCCNNKTLQQPILLDKIKFAMIFWVKVRNMMNSLWMVRRWKDGYWNIVDNHRNQIKTTHTHTHTHTQKSIKRISCYRTSKSRVGIWYIYIYVCRLIIRQSPQYTVIGLCEVELSRKYSYFLLKEF